MNVLWPHRVHGLPSLTLNPLPGKRAFPGGGLHWSYTCPVDYQWDKAACECGCHQKQDVIACCDCFYAIGSGSVALKSPGDWGACPQFLGFLIQVHLG
jgi:hypothetical protein